MVTFSDSSSDGSDFLIIADEGDAHDTSLMLPVYEPGIGHLAPRFSSDIGPSHPQNWHTTSKEDLVSIDKSNVFPGKSVCLRSTIHSLEADSRTKLLSESIYSGDAKWGKSTPTYGLVSFTRGYWEWLEYVLGRYQDVLCRAKIYNAVYASLFSYDRDDQLTRAFCEFWNTLTNTLHTHDGEISISLWDLYMIGGLPIHGDFYDEVVPSAKELSDDAKLLPRSCKHLFAAYHRVLKKSESKKVTADAWVEFWFRCDLRFDDPPRRYNRKTSSRPKLTHNPCGLIRRRNQLEQEKVVFDELHIDESDTDEVYLAALLSCWLCKFALPSHEFDHIRPSVFKVASLMATGKRFSLAIPVLASLYQGLSRIACSNEPSKCTAIFPIHYLYGWLGHYFNAYWTFKDSPKRDHLVRMVQYSGEKMAKYFSDTEARQYLSGLRFSLLSSLSLYEDKQILISDNGNLSSSWTDYIISLRSCYLTCRQDNNFIIEAYSPHRFSRQFNLHQDVPGELTNDIMDGTLAEVIALWKSSTLLSTHAKFVIPPRAQKLLTLRRYADWWAKYSRLSLGEPTDVDFETSPPDHKRQGALTIGRRKEEFVKLTPPAKVKNKACNLTDSTKPSRKSLVQNSAPKLSSVIVKNSEFIGIDGGANLPTDAQGNSSDQERNWKHVSNKRKACEIETGDNFNNTPDFPPCTKKSSNQVKEDEVAFSTSVGSVGSPRDFLAKSRTKILHYEKLVSPLGSELLEISETMKRRPQPLDPKAVPSGFQASTHIMRCHTACTNMLWTGLARKLTNDPLHHLGRLKVQADEILDEIAERGAPNITSLRRLVNLFFEDVQTYDSLRSGVNANTSDGGASETLKEIETRLSVAEEEQAHKIEASEGRRKRLECIDSHIQDLNAEKKAIEKLLAEDKEKLSQLQSDISNFREEKSSLDAASAIQELEQSLERSRDQLSKFKLFP